MSAKTAWGRAEATASESKREASEALEARDAALTSATSAKERCDKAEAELNALWEGQAAHIQRLWQKEEDLKACKAMLADRNAKLA